MADRKAGELKALQAALAGTHAALWGYGVLGPRLTGAALKGSHKAYDSYRTLRDELEDLVIARKGDPVAARAGYQLPFPVTDGTSARKLARHLEDGCAALFGDLVAAAVTAELRTFAASQLTACARRGMSWSDRQVAFPGLPERE
ncbi:ferritin-like domain-containing protein [Flindersiella endophytica]